MEHFVHWFRQAGPYINAHRGKTFVVQFGGAAIESDQFASLIHDLALLHALGIRLVLVHGARPQIEQRLREAGRELRYVNGLRLTDANDLRCVKQAIGRARICIESALSMGVANSPMQGARLRVVSGNLITARPLGVREGIDYGFTGEVRRIDDRAIRLWLEQDAIVLLSPLGYSPTGEAFNLSMEDVAASTAVALDADKLIVLAESGGIFDPDGSLRREVSEAEAKTLLGTGSLPDDIAFTLRHALRACEGGVARAHIIPYGLDGSVLLELFQHDGVGTMLVEETLEALREAGPDDIGGLIALLRPLEEDGTLVRRDRGLIEREIGNFTVIEHDGVIFGCAALYPYPDDGIGEMAALAVNPSVQGRGDGERLLQRIEQRARAAGLKRLFVLTTRTMHWFLKRGFVLATVDQLPTQRRGLYNWQRKSLVLIKPL